MYDLSQVVVTSSPHIKTNEDTRSIMLDVLLALLPALVVSIFTFGARSLVLVAVSVIASMVFELLYNKLTKQANTISDLSAAVTGVLLAYNLPVSAPLWMPILGALFAIIVVKMIFGGLGCNFMNPALAGRAFLLTSWAGTMTSWTSPGSSISLFGTVDIDAITVATPLSQMKPVVTDGIRSASLPSASLADLFLGQIGGCIGEVSALAILLGGIYLLWRKVITINIPAAYILTVAVLTFLFPVGDVDRIQWMLSHLFSGGLMLGAIFMATDYVTSPVTAKGQIIFGVGCGILTVFIRYFGGLPEGVSYSILIMNTLVWSIDKLTHPRKFGYKSAAEIKAAKKAEEAKS